MQLRKRGRAAQPSPSPREPSAWQEPPAFFGTVLERLLAMPDGTKHVRLASHVCHHWRVAAQEVLLADTAISKPPMEDFRAIGQQHPLPPAKQQKQETVTTQAAVVMEASASTGMEAISKQRFDGPPGALAAVAAGAAARGRGRSGRPAQPEGPNRTAAEARAAAAFTAAVVQQQTYPRLQLPQAPAERRQRQQQAQQQAQQQGSVGPGSTAPAGQAQQAQQAHAAGPSPSAQQQQPGEPEAPQGSIQSGMAMIGRRRTAALESESEGGSTRARGPTARRGSELSGGRGTSVEQPLRQPAQPQQAQQAAAGQAQRAAEPAAQGTTVEGGMSRPSSRRRRRSVSTVGTEAEAEGRPSKRQQTSEPRRSQRAGLRSSGPASGDGLPDARHHRPAQQAQEQQQAQQPVQQQQAQAGSRRRGRPSQARSAQQAQQQEQVQQPQQHAQEEQGQRQAGHEARPVQQAGEAALPVQLPPGKAADPPAASGSYYETVEGGAEVEQHVPQPAAGETQQNGGAWERSPAAEGGLQAAFNAVCRLLRLRD